MTSDVFGGVVYINLDKRTDRRNEIEVELDTVGLVYERFSAIEHPVGMLGCFKSHLEVLKLAKTRGWKNVLVFEDDFQFLVSKEEFWKQITDFFTNHGDFQVAMLAYNLLEFTPVDATINKVLYSTSGAGYIVDQSMYDRLISLWEWAYPKLEKTHEHWNYAQDMVWKSLQPQNNWYAFVTRIGQQRSGYSDVGNRYTDRANC